MTKASAISAQSGSSPPTGLIPMGTWLPRNGGTQSREARVGLAQLPDPPGPSAPAGVVARDPAVRSHKGETRMATPAQVADALDRLWSGTQLPAEDPPPAPVLRIVAIRLLPDQ